MKKILQLACDVAVTVGCCVGVGFISGKEAQVFFGNRFNAIIFCVVFFVVNFAVREYCRKHRCDDVHSLNVSLWRHPTLFDTLIALCSFVCIVTVLAGVEQCLGSIFNLGSKLPLYAFFAALIASLLLNKGMSALKVANVVAVLMAIALIAVLFATRKGDYVEDLQVPLYQPILYALFSLTMSLGVVTKLAVDSSKKENLISTLLSSVILTALMLMVLPTCKFNAAMPTIGGITNVFLLGFALVTLLISAVTGIIANAYPIAQYLYSVIPDKTLCCAITFGFALAFSMFGFDFAVKVGYLLVSVMGALIFVFTTVKQISKKKIGKATKCPPCVREGVRSNTKGL
ncbi:MAG: hypothetical protein J1F66_00045 [Clostridiales bacterium]|nr:hypothetical protein [Clostridiales bacterium]